MGAPSDLIVLQVISMLNSRFSPSDLIFPCTYLIITCSTLIHIFLVFKREVHGHAEPFCDEAELDPELVGKADSG